MVKRLTGLEGNGMYVDHPRRYFEELDKNYTVFWNRTERERLSYYSVNGHTNSAMVHSNPKENIAQASRGFKIRPSKY